MSKLFALFFLLPAIGLSQYNLHAFVFGGFLNYQGDLQSKPFTLEQSKGSFGLGLKYDISWHTSIRIAGYRGSIEGNDKTNKPSLQPRNLSFRSRIFEASAIIEYTLFDMSEKQFSPYAFIGAGVYRFNPYTFDTMNNKIHLQPLGTEGQGLPQYPDRKPYKFIQFSIPVGGGIKLRVSDNIVLSYEIGMRKLFTDYLDDVSTTYVDPLILGASRGPKAVEMSYRGGELKGGDPSYPTNTLRGGEDSKDWYYISGVTLSIGIADIQLFNSSKIRGNRMGCPKVF